MSDKPSIGYVGGESGAAYADGHAGAGEELKPAASPNKAELREAERDAALAEREDLRRLLDCFVRGESDPDENQSERHMYVTEAQSLLAHMGGEIKAHTLVPDEVLRNQSAELDACRKDAERYRLICEKAIDVTFWATGPAPIHGCVEIDPDQYPVGEFGSAKAELDALLDAEKSQEANHA